MDIFEFGIACRQYNIIYRELFDEIPSPVEYECTRESFFAALVRATEEKCKIETYLKKAPSLDMSRYEF